MVMIVPARRGKADVQQADYFADFVFGRMRCGRFVLAAFCFCCAFASCCSTSTTRSLAAQSSAFASVSSIDNVGWYCPSSSLLT